MPDICDDSDDRIELTRKAGIEAARAELERNQLPAIGVCHWCESPVGAGRVFCSTECRDDHEHERIRRRAIGK